MKEKHEKLIYDTMVGVSILFFITVHVLTHFAISKVAKVTGKDIEKVTKAIEKNPVAQYIYNLNRINKVLKMMLAPALVASSYIALRFLPGVKMVTLRFVSSFFLILSAINVSNDLALFLGMMY